MACWLAGRFAWLVADARLPADQLPGLCGGAGGVQPLFAAGVAWPMKVTGNLGDGHRTQLVGGKQLVRKATY